MTTATPAHTRRFRIRPAERADLLALYRIEQEAFADPWPFNAFERYLDGPGFLVADEGGIVGYVVAGMVSNRGKPLGHIKDLAVHRERRGEGIGTHLLRRALGVLDAQGADSVKLEVRAQNEGAIDLYRANGFEYRRTVPGYYNDGEDALILVHPLSA